MLSLPGCYSLVLLLLLACPSAAFETRWFRQPVNQLSSSVLPNVSYNQRYLLDSQPPTAQRLFFFCGNEGDVAEFANFAGLLRELAPSFGAAVVYAEHRFYGQSLPFGNRSFEPQNIRWLTAEQAMADYAALIRHLRTQLNVTQVVTFAGSYGGMLSSWMRAFYPSLVDAAVASSAPVRFGDVGPSFFRLVTEAAVAMSTSCPAAVRRGFTSLLQHTSQVNEVETAFGLCPGQLNSAAGFVNLVLWARNAFVTVAMGNYPYGNTIFGKGLSPWPLRAACAAVEQSHESNALQALANGVASYYNASGDVACHQIDQEYRACADQTGCGSSRSLWGRSWDHEACTEIVYFTSTNNRTDMFPPRSWGLTELTDYCERVWSVRPNATWWQNRFEKIRSSSYIVFSNGGLDPWRGGGVLQNLSSSLVAVHVADGAHIYDLAGAHALDTKDVMEARHRIARLLTQWLD